MLVPICLLVCVSLCVSSCGGKKTGNSAAVVVTSSWTAAYAWAAGAENVEILAPFEMAHPSEYELRPGDIPTLTNAQIVVYAGYEAMSGRLKKGLGLPPEKLLLIETDYSYESMEKSVMKIAARLGTEQLARENLHDIHRLLDEGRKSIDAKQMTGLPVVVHRFQASFARELGFIPVVLFGPASPEAREINTVSKSDAFFIMDNMHNPVGQPFKEVLPGARYTQLLNFPGQKGTKTLADVIRYNLSQLIDF